MTNDRETIFLNITEDGESELLFPESDDDISIELSSDSDSFLELEDEEETIFLSMDDTSPIELSLESSSPGVYENYERLLNKPSINGVTVLGDYEGEHYRLQDKMDAISEQDIDNMMIWGSL